jgi:sialic acid synthase SpsE/quercetin dioxygenase-like cupin family protein
VSPIFDNLFVFEMANNHQGQLNHGLRIVDEMAKIRRKHNIRAAVKLQYRDLDSIIHPDFVHRKDVQHIPRFLSTRLRDDEFQTLLAAVKDQDLLAMVTPFDEPSVLKCVEHGVDIIKVASCSALDWPLLTAIGRSGRPIIVSTGGCTLPQIDKLVSFLAHHECEFAIMHCVASYPCAPGQLHLNFVERLRRRYRGVAVGYSGHEDPSDTDAIKVAVAKGAVLFERHVGVATESCALNAYSLSPAQVDRWVDAARRAMTMCGGDDNKEISQEEVESLRSLQRGVFVRHDVAKGSPLTMEDVFFAMPCAEGQTTSGQFGQYRASFVASRDYRAREAVRERAQDDAISRIRSIVHDVKGFLYEAQVFLGKGVQAELSHHQGIDQFRRVGVTILTVINREYCKKLMVLLPGQRHPKHLHKQKEETFQLLYGDCTVNLDGRDIVLAPGDTLLVERSAMHSFKSERGAVVEEVSSTHYRDDSFYDDPHINSMDPMERKTLLADW